MSLSFCVMVPAYNEEQGVERCVREVCSVLKTTPCRSALIVVNDGSTDQTSNILDRLVSEYSMLDVVTCEINGGYGAAIRKGIERAASEEYEYIVFMDSDLTTNPKYIGEFVKQMQLGTEVIKASRYIQGGRVEGVPVYRVAISVMGNWLARLMYRLPLRDCTNGFQAIRVDLLRKMPLKETGFAIIMEELYYAKYLAKTFAEVPYTLTARTEHIRKSSFYYRPKIFYKYLKYPVKSLLRIPPRKVSSCNKGARATHDFLNM